MKKLITFILACSSLWTLSAQAEEIRMTGWNSILSELSDKGIDKIGALDLRDLKQEISSKVKWKKLSADERPDFAEARRSAYFIIENNTVYLNQEVDKDLEASLPQLELHEALGALGYGDRHYEISTSLEMLNQISNSKARSSIVKTLGESIFSSDGLNQLSGNGSGSGVGGGGDIMALTVKNAVLREILSKKSVSVSDFVKLYPTINFEPGYNPKQQYMAIEYKFVGGETFKKYRGGIEGAFVNPDLGYQELITFWIPTSIWKKGGRTRARLISEVADAVLELLPNTVAKNIETVPVQVCTGKVINYPKPRYQETYNLLSLRSQVVNGCKPVVDVFSILSPSFDPSYRVNQGKYICDLLVGQRVVNSMESKYDGDGGDYNASFMAPLRDGAFLFGTVSWQGATRSIQYLSVYSSNHEKYGQPITAPYSAQQNTVWSPKPYKKKTGLRCKLEAS